MAGDLLQFYTRATALVFLPLLKSRITWLLSSYVLQKVTCIYVGLGAARVQPALTTLLRAWVFASPWQNEDGRAVKCHRSVLGWRGFVEVSVLKLPSEEKALPRC